VGLDENYKEYAKARRGLKGAGEKSGLRGRRERACEEARAGRVGTTRTAQAGRLERQL
jgi:hypothetical protein